MSKQPHRTSAAKESPQSSLYGERSELTEQAHRYFERTYPPFTTAFRSKEALDLSQLLVYFYTTMTVEHTPIHPYFSTGCVAPLSPPHRLAVSSAPDSEPRPRSRELATRAALANYLELLLNSLRGEALLVAALAYGLRVPISRLRELRVRDISIAERVIFIMQREWPIPNAVMEDLREHLFENVCGREASIGVTKREDRLFSADAFEQLNETARSIQSLLAEQLQGIAQRRSFTCFDTQLKLLGMLHAKRMRRSGRLTPCPLDSIDKGPRIVRRGRGGAIDAYYRWRLSRIVA